MDIGDDTTFSPLVLLARRWRLLLLCGALGAVAGVIYAFMSPAWYEARLSVVPTAPSSEAGGALMSMTKDLPDKLGISVGVASDSERISTVFMSESVLDEVITKFDLRKRYGETHIEGARAQLKKHCSTLVDRKSDLVTLTCEDTEPAVVKAMVEYFSEVGARVFRRISASSAADERRFLEGRVDEARKSVDEASNKLKEYREKNKIIDLEAQSKAVVSAMGSLEGDRLSKQMELAYLDDFSSRDESSVVQLRLQIAAVEAQLKSLQEAKDKDAKSTEFFPKMSAVPELAFQLAQLTREEQIRERVFFLLTMQHELAKVKEARDTATFQVLDSPTLPTQKVRPKRRVLVAGGGLGGAALAVLGVLILGWWRFVFRRSATA
jgi:capsular polysaccharide transport system permease protein